MFNMCANSYCGGCQVRKRDKVRAFMEQTKGLQKTGATYLAIELLLIQKVCDLAVSLLIQSLPAPTTPHYFVCLWESCQSKASHRAKDNRALWIPPGQLKFPLLKNLPQLDMGAI